MNKFFSLKQLNNKGVTLVELIVAIGMSSIVAAGAVALMAFALRNYQNETANVAMQYETQTTINQLMDSVMQSDGMVMKQNGNRTEYAAFGKYTKGKDASDNDIIIFKGEIFYSVIDGSEITVYMNRGTWEGADEKAAADVALTEIQGQVSSGNGNMYLLAEHCIKFKMEPVNECLFTDTDGVLKYKNPITIKAEVEFAKDAYRTVKRKVTDETTMRNKAVRDIYYNDNKYIQKIKKNE